MNEPATKIWDATLYPRLSREDGDKEESNSVSGQRDLIRDYMTHHPELREYAVRIDDGFSGSTFERPSFRKGALVYFAGCGVDREIFHICVRVQSGKK